jgi:hypothetical protein
MVRNDENTDAYLDLLLRDDWVTRHELLDGAAPKWRRMMLRRLAPDQARDGTRTAPKPSALEWRPFIMKDKQTACKFDGCHA